jgi:ubiquitin-protein ligase E3 A
MIVMRHPPADPDFEDVFGLTFTATYQSWGETKEVELVPGGASKPVTAGNRKQYVHAYIKWLLVDSIARQFDAFSRGFNNVASGAGLDLFRPEELSLLVTGSEELDFHALEGSTTYEDPYTESHPVIKWFWYVEETLANFLRFDFFPTHDSHLQVLCT